MMEGKGAMDGASLSDDVKKTPLDQGFDASAAPPFTIGDLREAIPPHCWEKSLWRSVFFMAVDVAVVACLGAGSSFLDSWFVWPLYWVAQSIMFWALFCIGHDCGHGSFSNNKQVNNVAGHLSHCFVLVPFHGWRISHRKHHANTGHVENDESWYPLTESMVPKFPLRLKAPEVLLAFPVYLWTRGLGREGSHFHPESNLFTAKERADVLTSTTFYGAMLTLLLSSTVNWPLWTLKMYWVPYVLFTMIIAIVTYLHHHGYDEKIPWYRGKEWTYLRGALSTIDRDYGCINNVHHNIGTHVIHHLFPQIPHYHLVEATEAVKPILGKYYRPPQKSGLIPVHLISVLKNSFAEDHFVADDGDVVFYRKREEENIKEDHKLQ